MWADAFFWSLDVAGALFQKSDMSQPRVLLGAPLPASDDPRYPIRWLHVPVTVRREKWYQRDERHFCRAYFLRDAGNPGPNGEPMMLTMDGLLTPRDETTIRDDEQWLIPVAIRAERPGYTQTAIGQ